MTVYVEKAPPTSRYKWCVYHGRVKVSNHHKKSAALDKAFAFAREREAVLKEQLTDGTWRTIRNY